MDKPREPDRANHWMLDKKVPITLILALLAQFAMGVAAWVGMQERTTETEKRLSTIESQRLVERMSLVEAAVLAQRTRDEQQDRMNADSLGLVRQDIRELGSKMDRFLEREGRSH